MKKELAKSIDRLADGLLKNVEPKQLIAYCMYKLVMANSLSRASSQFLKQHLTEEITTVMHPEVASLLLLDLHIGFLVEELDLLTKLKTQPFADLFQTDLKQEDKESL